MGPDSASSSDGNSNPKGVGNPKSVVYHDTNGREPGHSQGNAGPGVVPMAMKKLARPQTEVEALMALQECPKISRGSRGSCASGQDANGASVASVAGAKATRGASLVQVDHATTSFPTNKDIVAVRPDGTTITATISTLPQHESESAQHPDGIVAQRVAQIAAPTGLTRGVWACSRSMKCTLNNGRNAHLQGGL
ncbi:MAG: hypothetical protein Q9159_002576 [Coniocarpon cinnabarinum]